jgi:hypothetical protein
MFGGRIVPWLTVDVVEDIANTDIDTEREMMDGADDNVATVNIVCRDIDFIKEVRSLTPSEGPFVTGTDSLNIPTIEPGGNHQIEYRYTVTNNGEITRR